MFTEFTEFLKSHKRLVAIAGLILASPFISYYCKFGDLPFSEEQEKWGQYGDFIGGMLNPLFAFLTFIFVTYTIHLQIQNNRETEANQRFELIQNKIQHSFDLEFPGRVYLGKSATAIDTHISFKKALNNFYNANLYKNQDWLNARRIKYDKIYLNEQVFCNELRTLSKVFRVFEKDLRDSASLFTKGNTIEFYKTLYSGDVLMLNTVIGIFLQKGFPIEPVLWFDSQEEFDLLHPGFGKKVVAQAQEKA